MASLGSRSVTRSLRAFVARSTTSSRSTSFPTAATPSQTRRIASFSRIPVELAAMAGGSLIPLHSAVAAARLTSRLSDASRSCRALSQDNYDGT
ncbi:uncharacterized protein LOC144571266 isoform X2 [Carex rostrata]